LTAICKRHSIDIEPEHWQKSERQIKMRSFTRGSALGLLLLFGIAVAAMVLSVFTNNWIVTTVRIRSAAALSEEIKIVSTEGLVKRVVAVDYNNTALGMSSNKTVIADDVFKYDTDQNQCDMPCRQTYIARLVMYASIAVGLFTWTVWLIMFIFGWLNHSLWASMGIWIAAIADCASMAIYIYALRPRFSADVTDAYWIPGVKDALALGTNVIYNVNTEWSYSAGLAIGGWTCCLVLVAAYISNVRSNAKLRLALNGGGHGGQVGPADGTLKPAKSATWVV